jgi:hypothetical protein
LGFHVLRSFPLLLSFLKSFYTKIGTVPGQAPAVSKRLDSLLRSVRGGRRMPRDGSRGPLVRAGAIDARAFVWLWATLGERDEECEAWLRSHVAQLEA